MNEMSSSWCGGVGVGHKQILSKGGSDGDIVSYLYIYDYFIIRPYSSLSAAPLNTLS